MDFGNSGPDNKPPATFIRQI